MGAISKFSAQIFQPYINGTILVILASFFCYWLEDFKRERKRQKLISPRRKSSVKFERFENFYIDVTHFLQRSRVLKPIVTPWTN